MKSEFSNAVMKGFAYEQFHIAKILGDVDARRVILGMDVGAGIADKVFSGDYPDSFALNTKKNTATLFRPRKYNLRYVDCVVRHVDGTGAVTITAIQITLQTPHDHEKSLGFYLNVHDGMADCCRYQHTSDKKNKTTHEFVWIVPHDATAPGNPPKCTVSFSQYVISRPIETAT